MTFKNIFSSAWAVLIAFAIGLMAFGFLAIGAPPLEVAAACLVVCGLIFAKRHGRVVLRMGGGFAVLLVFGASLHELRAQIYPTTLVTLTNLPTYVVGGATSNINSQYFEVPHGGGFSVSAVIAGTKAATVDALTLQFAPAIDGTNYATTNFVAFTAVPNGTTGQITWTNFAPATVDNARRWKLVKAISAAASTNKTFITNIFIGLPNS